MLVLIGACSKKQKTSAELPPAAVHTFTAKNSEQAFTLIDRANIECEKGKNCISCFTTTFVNFSLHCIILSRGHINILHGTT